MRTSERGSFKNGGTLREVLLVRGGKMSAAKTRMLAEKEETGIGVLT